MKKEAVKSKIVIKRILAAGFAFIILFCIFALARNIIKINENKENTITPMVASDITMREKVFGTWINQAKYGSCNDMMDNMAESSMLVFGSSEFNHGNDSIFHATNVFMNTNVNLMLVGTAYNQSLSMAEYLGALEPSIENKKVVIILSPSWFYRKGVTSEDYTKRFSEDAYIGIMENENISMDIKEYIAKRSEQLINDAKLLKRVKKYNRVYVKGNASSADINFVNKRKATIRKKAHKKLVKEMKKAGISDLSNENMHYNPFTHIEWNQLAEAGKNLDKGKRNNEYFIDDERFEIKYEEQVEMVKGSQIYSSFEVSPEYDDLRCFLNICKERDIDVLLIMQPQNGYWYDDTGLTADKRKVFAENIYALSSEYSNCKAVSYEDMEYEKYFLLDTVHLSGEGWSRVNEDIYKFYNE